MVDRAIFSAQVTVRLREAEATLRTLTESVESIRDTVGRTRAIIVESQQLLDDVSELLLR